MSSRRVRSLRANIDRINRIGRIDHIDHMGRSIYYGRKKSPTGLPCAGVNCLKAMSTCWRGPKSRYCSRKCLKSVTPEGQAKAQAQAQAKAERELQKEQKKLAKSLAKRVPAAYQKPKEKCKPPDGAKELPIDANNAPPEGWTVWEAQAPNGRPWKRYFSADFTMRAKTVPEAWRIERGKLSTQQLRENSEEYNKKILELRGAPARNECTAASSSERGSSSSSCREQVGVVINLGNGHFMEIEDVDDWTVA